MRLIDADALIDALDKGLWGKVYDKALAEAIIADAPTITQWIPCSERLPDIGADVLFCDDKWTEEGCLRADGDWCQFRWSTVLPKEKVVAWMPLPTPYEG